MEWPILAHLDDRELRAVLAAAVRRRFRDGDSVFHQGDPGSTFHLLDRGHVAIRATDRRGTVVTFEIAGPGSSFGEMALIGAGAPRAASAVAIGAVETMSIGRDAFLELQRRHPAVSKVLVEVLAARVRRLSDRLIDAHSMSAENRTRQAVTDLAHTFADGAVAVIPVTQEDIASLAGTTRPTANRAIRALVAQGLVEIRRGRIIVPDVERLAEGRRRSAG